MAPHLEQLMVELSDRLRRQKSELAVTEEQLAFLESEAGDARLRALVAETPVSEKEAREAQRQADAMMRQRDALRRSIELLSAEQDRVLDRMTTHLAAD